MSLHDRVVLTEGSLLKWRRDGANYVSHDGRFRIENWSDSHSRSWPLFDGDKIVSTASGPKQHDRLTDAKRTANTLASKGRQA